jgi:hypothetical protein
LTALGQAEEGLALITKGLKVHRATGSIAPRAHDTRGSLRRLGQPVEGLNCLAEAAQIIETTEERVGKAEVHRVRGDLLNATGDRAAAEQSYH